jgi:hypothetical protein
LWIKEGSVQHLERFFSSLLSAKEFWAAVLGAVIGGYMTGRYSLKAQKQAASDQRQRDIETERRTINGTLQAIAAELKVLKTSNFDILEKTLKDRSDAREKSGRRDFPPPLAMTHTEPNRVTVFESNAGMLGKIEDAELREKIIRVYEFVKGLIDSLNANARAFERWRSLPDSHQEKPIVAEMLLGLEQGIQNGLADLQRELGELLKMIEKHLNS